MSGSFFSRDEHLTDAELDAMVMGVDDADARTAHMLECAMCRTKLTEMRAMVESFREGALLWQPRVMAKTFSERLYATQNGRKSRHVWMTAPAMGLAAAMLVAGVTGPHWIRERHAAEQARLNRKMVLQQAQAATDDALMQQVQQQLDEDVPASMTPLTALIQTEEPHKATRQAKEN